MSNYWKTKVPPWPEFIGMILGAIIVIVFVSLAYGATASEGQAAPAEVEKFFSPVGMMRMGVSVVFTGFVGYLFWTRQNSVTRKEAAKALLLEKELGLRTEEKERIAEGHRELMLRVTTLEKTLTETSHKLALMSQEALPMFEAMKQKLVQVLTHPSDEFKVPDNLLEKVNGHPPNLSEEEMTELERLLKERETDMHPEVTPTERLAAAILPSLIKLAAIEAKTTDEVTSLQLVSSTMKTESAKLPVEKGSSR